MEFLPAFERYRRSIVIPINAGEQRPVFVTEDRASRC